MLSLSCIADWMCILFGRRMFLWKVAQSQSKASTEYSGLQSQANWISCATFSKNNLSITFRTGISATSTTQSSSPQHPMQKIGNWRHLPLLLNPHSPLQLDLLKYNSYPWLLFFLLQVPSPKLIHNAFQWVGLSVFAGMYVIMFVDFGSVVISPALSGLQLCAYQICILYVTPKLCWRTMLPLNCELNILLGSL